MAEELSLDTRKEADATPEKAFRRWLLEIQLAKKREKKYREKAVKIIETYRGTKRKANSFNILWANTEVLRPALYNSSPKPDVRRRFRQKDMLGKAVSEVMERSLSYCVDAYDLDNCLQNDVLDALLPGRGLSRVRYVPKIKTVPSAAQDAQAATPAASAVASTDGNQVTNPAQAEGAAGTVGGDREEVEYEQALCEHVQWDDFLHGPGKVWEEVQWTAFAHDLTRDDQIEKFGEEVAKKVTLDNTAENDVESDRNKDIAPVFKTARFWEVWDKQGGKVFFLNESYKVGLIYPKAEAGQEDAKRGDPPLKLKNFFPIPRPLQLVEDTGSLIPQPLYEFYVEQAAELDRISIRINKIVNACKVRFAYDPTLTELEQLTGSGDNEGIPVENARAWMANGGLEKAIWWMPVEKLIQVLRELYIARDACKQVIYEITGISDIIRGVTNPNETLGAQKLKANSSSLRLQRMQREVQRYTRDLIRLLAEVIGENFSPETLAQMTGLQFPTTQQKQMIGLQLQAMQKPQLPAPQGQPGMPAQQPQQPAPPPETMQAIQRAMQMPTWEEIMAVLKSDIQREYRVDVETDSTVAQSLQQDMEGLREVITGLVEFWQGVGPAVQSGALKIDAVKAISMSIVRRARMGLEVEDALESGMQEPKPQSDPKAAAEAQKQQQAQVQAQHDQMLAQRQQQHEEQVAAREHAFEQQKAQQEAALEDRRMQQEAANEQRKMEFEAAAKQRQSEMDAAFQRFKALLDSITKVEVAEIGAEATLSASQSDAARKSVQ